MVLQFFSFGSVREGSVDFSGVVAGGGEISLRKELFGLMFQQFLY
jgi:hypothetical protein